MDDAPHRLNSPALGMVLSAGLGVGSCARAPQPDSVQAPQNSIRAQHHYGYEFSDPDRRDKLATAFAAIREHIETRTQVDRIPGLSFGLVVDEELVLSGAWGFRSIEHRLPMRVDTAVRIASATKPFTALAVLHLRDTGRLALDDRLDDYVRSFGVRSLSDARLRTCHPPTPSHPHIWLAASR